MKTEWDYTMLADAYLKRPDYSDAAIDAMLSIAKTDRLDNFCDVGAGVAHLTLKLAARKLSVVAVEPNDAMRINGIKRTEKFSNVSWHEGTGEATGQVSKSFDMVTFGSSFNVCDRQQALKESARILKAHGWFACMWNHRQLEDPIQTEIEAIIRKRVTAYCYGTRRDDQTKVIEGSGLFGPVVHLDSRVIHEQTLEECIEAWRSHATLARQAGDEFHGVIAAIEDYLRNIGTPIIRIPYTTNIWLAQLH